jgi:Kef-type K+ transport system membrane component KefB
MRIPTFGLGLRSGAGVTILAVLSCVMSGAGPAFNAGKGGASSSDGIGASLLAGFHTPVSQLLLQLIVIVAVARCVGLCFRRIGQPAVVGEMFAGLALGPSFLGAAAPQCAAFVFPQGSLGALHLLSQIGVVLFMFGVGMEPDTAPIRRNTRSIVLVSQAGIIVPFILGTALSLLLYGEYAGENSPFPAFCLFMGISMSITAFPVLARILRERDLTATPLGAAALACAAVDDVTAWCGLAFTVAISRDESLTTAATTVALSAVFVAVWLLLVAPALTRVASRGSNPAEPSQGVVVLCLLSLFAAALTTEVIGIHALFGAFLAGVAMPKDLALRAMLRDRIESFGTLVLLPVFFAFTGLRTQIGLLDDAGAWRDCLLIIVVAFLAKIGGVTAAARLVGQPLREAAALGVLMNTRGLMELIALNLGYDMGVLSPRLFTMLVLMALVTTCATGPLLRALGYRQCMHRRHGTG